MTLAEMFSILDDLRFNDYVFRITEQNSDNPYLQATYYEKDIVTGKPELQHTRKWRLSANMTKSEFVQTAFKLCMTSMEHRTREHFRYKGSAVYSPHYDVDALYDLCQRGAFDYRAEVVDERSPDRV